MYDWGKEQTERETENPEADFPLSAEPDTGLDSRIPKS